MSQPRFESIFGTRLDLLDAINAAFSAFDGINPSEDLLQVVSPYLTSVGLRPATIDDNLVSTDIPANAPLPDSSSTSPRPLALFADFELLQIKVGLGVATVLANQQDELGAPARMIFRLRPQAEAIAIDAEPFKDVAALYALCDDPTLPPGTAGVKAGRISPEVTIFRVSIFDDSASKSAHEKKEANIKIASEIVTSLGQTLNRKTNPLRPVYLAFSSISSENAKKDGAVELYGRYYVMEKTDDVSHFIRETVGGECAAYGATAEFEIVNVVPPVESDAQCTEILLQACEKILPAEQVWRLEYPGFHRDRPYFSGCSVPMSVLFVGSGHTENRRHAFPMINSMALNGVKIIASALLRHSQLC